MIKIQEIIEGCNLYLRKRKGVSIVLAKDRNEGLALTKNILYKLVDKDTALFLSGGSTPGSLYQDLAKEKKLHPGAAAMVDERYGEPNHKNSNEKMIYDTGLISYFKNNGVMFSGILKRHLEGVRLNLENMASAYNRIVQEILSRYSKRVAIVGVGEDGHTASIPSGIQNLEFVTGIDDFPIGTKERITLTFKALSKMDLLLLLVFGEDKKMALIKMFQDGSTEEVPARFYKKPDIAKKTILITDQKL